MASLPAKPSCSGPNLAKQHLARVSCSYGDHSGFCQPHCHMGSFRGLATSYSGVYNSENICFVSLLEYSFLSSPSSVRHFSVRLASRNLGVFMHYYSALPPSCPRGHRHHIPTSCMNRCRNYDQALDCNPRLSVSGEYLTDIE